MKKYLLLLVLMLPFTVLADEPHMELAVFGSSIDDGQGAKFGLHGGDSLQWAIDYSMTNSLNGISVAAGPKLGEAKLLFGIQWVDRFEMDSFVTDINGDNIQIDSRDGDGAAVFAELYYQYFFARVIYYEVERYWDGFSNTPQFIHGQPNPNFDPSKDYKTGTQEDHDSALWLGLNYPFD
jgi:hypothetical protein